MGAADDQRMTELLKDRGLGGFAALIMERLAPERPEDLALLEPEDIQDLALPKVPYRTRRGT